MSATDYNKQAQGIADKLGIKLSVKYKGYGKYFTGDTQSRHVFRCRLSRGRKSYSFDFGQSIQAGDKEPTLYCVLSCLTKYDPESFEFFCANYGYDEDSRAAEKVYNSVMKEWEAMGRLFTDEELELLQDIE